MVTMPKSRRKPQPAQRAVPAEYQEATLTMVGTSPLLMHAGDYDRESPENRDFVALTGKQRKTLDDMARIRELEWARAIYLDDVLGPYAPNKWVHTCLQNAATKWRKGADVTRSLVVVDNRIPLQYDGPRDQQSLWDEGFYYTTLVTNSGMNHGRVERTRPCFDDWAIETTIAWDPEDLDYDMLVKIVNRSQKYGLGDGRSAGFGLFEATLGSVQSTRISKNASGTKEVDQRAAQGHHAQRRLVASKVSSNGTAR